MTALDIETITHLDFDSAIVCDGVKVGWAVQPGWYDEDACENPAEFKAVRGCCGQVEFLCSPCIELLDKINANICRFCMNTKTDPMYISVDKIGGRS